MKKYILLAALLVPSFASAQNAFDALRYSQVNYQGTARSMGLGNAMTALGGDFGAITINPAGSALYPYSEISFTPYIGSNASEVVYQGQYTDDRISRAGISHVGYVGSLPTGRGTGAVGVTFAVGYNKVQDFTSRTSVKVNGATTSWLTPVAEQANGFASADMEYGDNYNPYFDSGASWRSILAWNTYLLDLLPETTDQYIAGTENLDGTSIYVGGPLDQRFSKESSGSVGEYLLNMGLNVGDRVYLGASATFQSIYYKGFERFTETTQDPSAFQTGLEEYTHTYDQTTNGVGFNLKVGVIVLPTHNLRIGMSISTPTWTRLSEEWQETISAYYTEGNNEDKSPLGFINYNVRTPMHLNLGFAYTFGNAGLISVDYEGVNYRSMHLKGVDDPYLFEDVNEAIQNPESTFQYANNLRVGGEIRLNPMVLRAGYSFYDKPEASYDNTHIASAGIGFRNGNGFFTDLGLAYRLKEKETFSLYNEEIYGTNQLSNLKVLLTLGWRF